MFRLIEAHHFRCLRSVSQSIRPFEILVGSNGSGKSTFLDVVQFIGEVLTAGLDAAIEQRTSNFHDLVWGRNANSFELAVEAELPDNCREIGMPVRTHFFPDAIRYEMGIRLDTSTEQQQIASERVTFRYIDSGVPESQTEILSRSNGVRFHSEETLRKFEGVQPHRNYTVLQQISDSEFPATAWLRERLRYAIKPIALDTEELRKPSPPAVTEGSVVRGAYLARSVSGLKEHHSERFQAWLRHVQTVLPDIKDIRTQLREEDRHRYLVIDYQNGVSVPSWIVSDGTLRLLALTVLAYSPDFDGVYLVEEPENGVHPAALQAIYESLSSMYGGQVLIASHSPVLLSLAKPEQLLCFSKTPDGVRIVRGSDHRALRDWQGEVSLGMMAASGILG